MRRVVENDTPRIISIGISQPICCGGKPLRKTGKQNLKKVFPVGHTRCWFLCTNELSLNALAILIKMSHRKRYLGTLRQHAILHQLHNFVPSTPFVLLEIQFNFLCQTQGR